MPNLVPAQRKTRFLPLGIRSLVKRPSHDLAPHAPTFVQADTDAGFLENLTRTIFSVVFSVLGLVGGGVLGFALGGFLAQVTGWAFLQDLIAMPIFVFGVMGFPMLGLSLSEALINRIWPRGDVATLGLDENKAVAALPQGLARRLATGLDDDLKALPQGKIQVARAENDVLVVLDEDGEEVALPRRWRKKRIVAGELAPHPRKKPTHVLTVEDGYLVVRGQSNN
jgi:hypothetical protein